MTDALALTARAGLPEDLKLLLGAYPRRIWGDHPNFGGLSRFYLDRHAMFREALAVMERQTGETLDKRHDPAVFGRDFARVANFFLGELTAHHQIEDHSYFPALVRLEPRLERGFEMLETDHEAIHGLLEKFQAEGTATLRALAAPGWDQALGRLAAELTAMRRLLDRHLTDEEELVVPIMLDKGEAALDF
jgi:hemerythrin-like domain-containing protein